MVQQRQRWAPLVFLFVVIGSMVLISMYKTNYSSIMSSVRTKTSLAEDVAVQGGNSHGVGSGGGGGSAGVKAHDGGVGNAASAVAGSTVVGSDTVSDADQFTLSSPMFVSGSDIPRQYTCTDEAGNPQTSISPPLEWANVPTGTTQYLVTLSTGETKDTTTYDWAVYNIPGSKHAHSLIRFETDYCSDTAA